MTQFSSSLQSRRAERGLGQWSPFLTCSMADERAPSALVLASPNPRQVPAVCHFQGSRAGSRETSPVGFFTEE